MAVKRLMKTFEEVIPSSKLQVAAFYCFTPIKDEVIDLLLDELTNKASEGEVKGTVLIASEGINGTICGPIEGVTSLLEQLQASLLEKTLEFKVSWTTVQAFRRFKARKKREIVTMGVEGINPRQSVGVYVDPLDWNSCLSDPDTLVIDTRNGYEVAIGSFEGALNPYTDTFREFPAWVDSNLHMLVEERQPRRIAMFCTGGIRCEKATSYLLQEGFEGVHHLQGGILKYLEEVPKQKSLWNGECFVFDQRVALNHKLLPGVHCLCYACGMPLSPKETQSSNYIRGVKCLHCADLYTDEDRVRFAERQKQFDERTRNLPENIARPSS